MVGKMLDKLLNAKHASSGLRRQESTAVIKTEGIALKLGGGEIPKGNRQTISKRKECDKDYLFIRAKEWPISIIFLSVVNSFKEFLKCG